MNTFQTFIEQLERMGISLGRSGRLELSKVIGKTVHFQLPAGPVYLESTIKVVLRSELVAEFEKQGLSTEDSFRASEIFLEMVEKGELK